jgi:hypothetical protein
VRIACRTAPCSGTITLKRSAKGKVLAKGTYVLRRGGTKSFVLRLTAAGRQAFAHAHRRPVKVRLVVSVKGARPLARTVVVTA